MSIVRHGCLSGWNVRSFFLTWLSMVLFTIEITDPSNPAGRRKEIDNVMKRARQASPGSWDRKLLEVEEKDPNR